MDVLPRAGRYCLGFAVAASGLMQIVNAGFVRLVPKLPAWVPAPEICAVAFGVVLVLIGGAILLGYGTRAAALVLAGLLLVAFGFRLPELAPNSGALVNPAKILALLGAALSLGIMAEKRLLVASAFFGLFFLICGWAHFQYSGFVDTMVPAWIPPSQRFWTYFSAMALLAGGAGVLVPPTRRVAAILSGVMVFLWVLILHIPLALKMRNASELAGVFEALALTGVAWLVAAQTSQPEATHVK
jgi:uncharacterized membrane protein YphA (DoxX/SURF4 family)